MSTETVSRSESTPMESPRTTHADDSPLPLDEVFSLLANERRRRVFRILETTEATTLGELAEHIAAVENDKPVDAITSTERKRVYICLYQSHLPAMDDAGVIDFDEDRKTVEPGANAGVIRRYLPRDADDSAGDGGVLTSAVRECVDAVQRRFRTVVESDTPGR